MARGGTTAAGIRVVLASVPPAAGFGWSPELHDVAATIRTLNEWIKTYAAQHHHVYVDYHSALADDRGGLPLRYSEDGVHPNTGGLSGDAALGRTAVGDGLEAVVPAVVARSAPAVERGTAPSPRRQPTQGSVAVARAITCRNAAPYCTSLVPPTP
jgi:hypothetical protein